MTQRIFRLVLVILLLALIAVVGNRESYQAYQHSDTLRIWFFDVGQGDAILIDTPDSHQILIDGGPDNTVMTRLSKVLPANDKELDLVISTHDDADHLKGLNFVLQNYKVDKLWVTGAVATTATYKTFVSEISKNNVDLEKVMAGASYDQGGLSAKVLSPLTNYDGVKLPEQNIASIVTYWRYGQETFLMTGDTQAPQETAMLNMGLVQHADILKIAHHGSATSSSAAFLEVVSPKLAVISAGKNNSYHLPNQGVLDRIKSFGIKILRTDEDGTIRCDLTTTSYSCLTNQ